MTTLLLKLARQWDSLEGRRAHGPREEQLVREDLASKDPDRLDALALRQAGLQALWEHHARAEENGIWGDEVSAGLKSWALAPAISTAIALRSTHRPMMARIHRLCHLGTRADMLLRSTAPMLTLDGSGLSPADLVANLLADAAQAAQREAGAFAGLPTYLSLAAGAAAAAARTSLLAARNTLLALGGPDGLDLSRVESQNFPFSNDVVSCPSLLAKLPSLLECRTDCVLV